MFPFSSRKTERRSTCPGGSVTKCIDPWICFPFPVEKQKEGAPVLLGLSQSAYIPEYVSLFQYKNRKREYLSCWICHKVHRSL